MAAKKKTSKRANKSAPAKSGAVRKRAAPRASLTAALAEAAWAEADDALAEALVELDHLQTATTAKAREAAGAMLAQALSRVARKRGLTRLGALDERVAFDAGVHELSADGKAPKSVRIVARGVARGGDVLRRPQVAAIAAKKAPAKRGAAKRSPGKR